MPARLPPSALARLALLEGRWRGDVQGGAIEELWLAPEAGLAQGMVRFVRDGAIATIELILVRAEPDGETMRYHHFNSDLSPWESDGPITLDLTHASETELVFTNLAATVRHAAEVGYRRTAPDALFSWVDSVAPDGVSARFSFDYRRIG